MRVILSAQRALGEEYHIRDKEKDYNIEGALLTLLPEIVEMTNEDHCLDFTSDKNKSRLTALTRHKVVTNFFKEEREVPKKEEKAIITASQSSSSTTTTSANGSKENPGY